MVTVLGMGLPSTVGASDVLLPSVTVGHAFRLDESHPAIPPAMDAMQAAPDESVDPAEIERTIATQTLSIQKLAAAMKAEAV